jgi:hypothetical protein
MLHHGRQGGGKAKPALSDPRLRLWNASWHRRFCSVGSLPTHAKTAGGPASQKSSEMGTLLSGQKCSHLSAGMRPVSDVQATNRRFALLSVVLMQTQTERKLPDRRRPAIDSHPRRWTACQQPELVTNSELTIVFRESAPLSSIYRPVRRTVQF